MEGSFTWQVTPDCRDEGPWVATADYDAKLVQQLCIAVPSLIANLLVVYYYVTVNHHPKFVLRMWRAITLRFHVGSGIIEIFTAVAAWFVYDPVPFCLLQAVASLVHCSTALLQIPIVFGTQIIMKPAYTMVVVVKVYLAANLLFHPTCYARSLVLFNVLSIYAWCRVFLLFFDKYSLFSTHEYSFSILWAGSIVLPLFGFSACLFASLGMIIYVVMCERCMSDVKWALETSELSRDMFSNSSCPWLRAGGRAASQSVGVAGEAFHSRYMLQLSAERGCASADGSPGQVLSIDLPDALLCHERLLSTEVLAMAEMATSPEEEARTIFCAVDRDGSGTIEWRELAIVLCCFGLPLSDTKAIMRQCEAKIDFDTFFDRFKPFWLYAFRRLLRSKSRKAKLDQRDALSRRPSLLDRNCSEEVQGYKPLPLAGA